MARRRTRFNIRLFTILISTAAVAGGGVFWVVKNQKPKNPQLFIAAGKELMQKKDWAKAINNLLVAEDLIPEDLKVHLMLGQCYYEQRGLGLDNVTSAVNEFTKAEVLKPDSVEAWEGLLKANEIWVELWENRPGDVRNLAQLPTSINLAAQAASHLAVLEPDNLEAKSAESILIIRVWILNLTMPEPSEAERLKNPDQFTNRETGNPLSPEERAEVAIADLTKMQQDHPESDKIPYWIARAKIKQAQNLITAGNEANAPQLFSEASTQFDASINLKPDVVGLYLNKAAIQGQLQTANPDPNAWQEYRKLSHDALDQAQARVDFTKNIQEYMLAKRQWADNLRGTDPAKAEGVYRDLIAKFPDELTFRESLADLLQRLPGRRSDALAVLDEISKLTGPSVTNIQARYSWDYVVAQCKLLRADIETDQLAGMPPGKARDQLVTDITNSIDAGQKIFGGQSSLLRVQGRFQLVNGQIAVAIQTLTRAMEKMTVESGSVNYQLLKNAADAYRAGGMTTKAIDLMEKAASDPNVPNKEQFQFVLADLYIANQDYDKAKPCVDWLAQRLPGDPRVTALQIRQLGPNADQAMVKQRFDKLPEQTPQDIGAKYNMAVQLNLRDDAIRLMTLINQGDPSVENSANLVRLLMTANRNDEAKTTLAAAEKVHPDDPTLKLFADLLNNQSNQAVEDEELKLILAISDPFVREGKLAEFYRLKENPEEELRHLLEQLRIQPDNKDVLGTVFVRHLDAKRFSDAEAMLPHMAEIDADQTHGLMLKCKLALAKQDVPNALIFSRQMTHDFQDFASSWEMYGEALRASGQWDLAVQQFNTAKDLDATNIETWRNLIQCSVQQGKLSEAKNYIVDACKRFPTDPSYKDMRVQFEILYGDPEKVVAELNGDVDQHPDDRHNYGMLANALMASSSVKSQLGQADAASDYLSQAIVCYKKAVGRWPDDIRFTTGLSQMLMQTNDFAGAEKCLKTLSDRPHWKGQPAPLVSLARVYLTANDPKSAEAVLNDAIAEDPRYIDARMVMCDCLILEQKYDLAVATLMPMTSDFRIREKYVDLLIGMGRGSQAEVDLQDAIKANPTNVALVNLLLHVYDAEGEYDRGIRAASQDILDDSRNVSAYLWRGKMEASGANRDLDLAMADLNVFTTAVPTSVDARVVMAEIQDAKRNKDEAIHQLETALSFDAQNRHVRLFLLQEYMSSTPPRNGDGERLLTQTLAMPIFQHDPQFESQMALLCAKKGDSERAVAFIQDAMDHTKDKDSLAATYYEVLLTASENGTKDTKYLSMLVDHSEKYASDPKSSWIVFNDRGCAKAGLGDPSGALAEFTIALDRAGVVGLSTAETVASTISRKLGPDKALELVLPRADNSDLWKIIAVDLEISTGEKGMAKAISLVEAALPSVDSLPAEDRMHLYQQASSLYLSSNPPMVDKASVIYQKILAIRPDDIDSLNDMACVLIDMTTPPNPPGALVYSQKAFDLSQKSGRQNPRIYDTQGWVLVQNDRVDDGIAVMHVTIDQANFPDAHYHLAVAYLKKQMPEQAQTELNLATDMIEKCKKDNVSFDKTLPGKIDAVAKQIDDANHAKPPTKSAS